MNPSRTNQKVVISTIGKADSTIENTHQRMQPKGRFKLFGLTGVGFLILIGSLTIALLGPKWIEACLTRQEPSMAIVRFMFWDKDHGHAGSYAVGTLFAMIVFYIMSQFLEALSFPTFSERE